MLQNNGRAAHQEVDHVGLDFPFIRPGESAGRVEGG